MNVTEIHSFPQATEPEIDMALAWSQRRMDQLIVIADRGPEPGMSRVTWLSCEMGPVMHALGMYNASKVRRFFMWTAAWKLNAQYNLTTGIISVALLGLMGFGMYRHDLVISLAPMLPLALGLYLAYASQWRYAKAMLNMVLPGLRRPGEDLAGWMRRWEASCPEKWRQHALAAPTP